MRRRLLDNSTELTMFCLFIFSFINSTTFLVYLGFLCLQGMKDVTWLLKSLIWISLRTIVNYQIATVGNGIVQMTKWGSIFLLATLLVTIQSDENESTWTVNRVIIPLVSLGAYLVVHSILFSGYPLTSVFKAFSYLYVYIAILVGIGKLASWMDISSYMYHSIRSIMILSIFVFPFRALSFSTASLYQGFTNQSNMFGLMAALFFATFYYELSKKKCLAIDMFIAAATFVLVIFSGSRNGMLTIAILTLIYFLISDHSISIKVLVAIVLIAIIGFALSIDSDLKNGILSFIYKVDDIENAIDSNRDIFISRNIQRIQFLQKFNENKWFGTGFAVPYNGGAQDWSLYFSLIVEPGNIVYAILGDIGVVGLIFIISAYLCIWFNRVSSKSLLLFVAPFSVSIGEMVFFSTNNMAMLLYIMFGLVLFDYGEEWDN